MMNFDFAAHWAAIDQVWQDDWAGRQRLRAAAPDHLGSVLLSGPEEIERYQRAWYYGGRPHDFFALLLENAGRADSDLVQFLPGNSPELLRGFFAYWTLWLAESIASPGQLKLLVALYRPAWEPFYEQLLPTLSLANLKFLQAKTANRQFISFLERHIRQVSSDSYLPGLAFGREERDQLRTLAFRYTQKALNQAPDPEPLLGAGEALFHAGDLNTALWTGYALKAVDPEFTSHWNRNALWTKLLPWCALQLARHDPCALAAAANRDLLDGALPASVLSYLQLYSALAAGMSLPYPFSPLEVHRQTVRLLEYRPDDLALLHFKACLTGALLPDETLVNTARELFLTQPFESFMLLEMNRFLIILDYPVNREVTQHLARLYRKLHEWLPDHLTWNPSIEAALARD